MPSPSPMVASQKVGFEPWGLVEVYTYVGDVIVGGDNESADLRMWQQAIEGKVRNGIRFLPEPEGAVRDVQRVRSSAESRCVGSVDRLRSPRETDRRFRCQWSTGRSYVNVHRQDRQVITWKSSICRPILYM